MSEALRLAELIERDYHDETLAPRRAAAELRRLAAENKELGQAIKRAIERNNELEVLNAELVEALQKIALTDYRGNQSQEIAIARAALAKVEASK